MTFLNIIIFILKNYQFNTKTYILSRYTILTIAERVLVSIKKNVKLYTKINAYTT